jgi:hypothetical protein
MFFGRNWASPGMFTKSRKPAAHAGYGARSELKLVPLVLCIVKSCSKRTQVPSFEARHAAWLLPVQHLVYCAISLIQQS